MAILSRRRCFGSASALPALPAFAGRNERGILVTASLAAKLRTAAAPAAVRRSAGAALKSGPWSVVI